MRLIDADVRVTVQSFDTMNEEYSHDEMTVADALDFATDEGCPPTIDAIPVEWLRSQLKNNPNDIESAYDDICINELIDRWQKEQEAQK